MSRHERAAQTDALLGPRFLVSGRRHATACAVVARDAVLSGTLVPGPAKLLERFVGSTVEALIATAIGLFAAIPAVIAYNRFAARSETLISRYYTFADEFQAILHRKVHTSEE